MVRVDCPLKDQSYRTCRGRWGQSCSPTLTWPSCRHVPTAARFLVEASCPAVPRRGYWIIRVGRGFLSGIVEGGVGGAGARAADGVGRGVCFGRPLGCLRACADDESQPNGKIPPDWEDSIRSATSNMVESVPLARVSMVCVSPGTCRLARSTQGRTRNRHLAPGTWRAASCDVRGRSTAAPGGFKRGRHALLVAERPGHVKRGRLARPGSDGWLTGRLQARAARARDQESPPNREPRGTANRCTADTTAARTRTLRHNRTRQAAASMVRQTNKRLTDTTAHNARRRRLTSHEHTTLPRPGTNATDLADSSPASDATAVPRKPSAHTKPSIHPPTGHAGHYCGDSRPNNETTTTNTNYPAPTRRKITTKPTRFIL